MVTRGTTSKPLRRTTKGPIVWRGFGERPKAIGCGHFRAGVSMLWVPGGVCLGVNGFDFVRQTLFAAVH